MRIFITGNRGQLGQALRARLPDSLGGDRPTCDVTDLASVTAAFQVARPEVVIHCAALTDVDGCARDPERAYRVNGLGTQNVALAAERLGAAVVYVSTNEVFDGQSPRPYVEFDSPNPINPYGQSKRAGEWFVLNLCRRPYVVRTAWLYAAGGHNFIHVIRRLADEHGSLRVVTDEVASPTYASDLAEALVKLIQTEHFGIYHLVNQGQCSRYAFARRILDLTGRPDVPIEPITRADYPRPSTPPAYSVLANVCGQALGIQLRGWEEALAEFLGMSQ